MGNRGRNQRPAAGVVLVAVAALLALAACERGSAVIDPDRPCTVLRIAEEARRTPAGQLPPDDTPRPGVLPTPELTPTEAAAAGDCIRPILFDIARRSDSERLRGSTDWPRVGTQFYRSEHGRYLEVSINALAAGYTLFEDGPRLPVGAIVKKQGYTVLRTGAVVAGPQFLMERMPAGYDERIGDWRFTLITGAGSVLGESRGRDGEKVEFCVECHRSARRQDFLFFVPPDYRPRS